MEFDLVLLFGLCVCIRMMYATRTCVRAFRADGAQGGDVRMRAQGNRLGAGAALPHVLLVPHNLQTVQKARHLRWYASCSLSVSSLSLCLSVCLWLCGWVFSFLNALLRVLPCAGRLCTSVSLSR